MARIVRRPAAERDLRTIWRYIAEDSPDRASAFLRQIEEKIQLIATQPMIGAARFPSFPDVRYFPYARYLIIYKPLLNRAGIELVRVLHSAQDIESLFGERDR